MKASLQSYIKITVIILGCFLKRIHKSSHKNKKRLSLIKNCDIIPFNLIKKEDVKMLGVAVNVATVLLGSLIGLVFKKGISKKYSDAVMTGIGLCTVLIGVQGMLKGENVLVTIICSVQLSARQLISTVSLTVRVISFRKSSKEETATRSAFLRALLRRVFYSVWVQ